MSKTVKCLACDMEVGPKSINSHVRKVHKLSKLEYYEKYVIKRPLPKCANPTCSKVVKFERISRGHNRFCSRSCSSSIKMKKILEEKWKDSDYIKEKSLSMSRSIKEKWEDDSHRSRMTEKARVRMNKLWEDPEFIEDRKRTSSENLSNLWKTSEFRYSTTIHRYSGVGLIHFYLVKLDDELIKYGITMDLDKRLSELTNIFPECSLLVKKTDSPKKICQLESSLINVGSVIHQMTEIRSINDKDLILSKLNW